MNERAPGGHTAGNCSEVHRTPVGLQTEALCSKPCLTRMYGSLRAEQKCLLMWTRVEWLFLSMDC